MWHKGHVAHRQAAPCAIMGHSKTAKEDTASAGGHPFCFLGREIILGSQSTGFRYIIFRSPYWIQDNLHLLFSAILCHIPNVSKINSFESVLFTSCTLWVLLLSLMWCSSALVSRQHGPCFLHGSCSPSCGGTLSHLSKLSFSAPMGIPQVSPIFPQNRHTLGHPPSVWTPWFLCFLEGF